MRFLGFCSVGLFALGCGGDEFVAMKDDAGNKAPIDSSVVDSMPPANDSGSGDGMGPQPDSGPMLPFCTGQNPTAIFCADWDKPSAQMDDAYLVGFPTKMTATVQSGGSLSVSGSTSVSPLNSLLAMFTSSNEGTVSTDAIVAKDKFLGLQVVHLSFSFRLGASVGTNTIELGAILVHFQNSSDDFPILIQETGGQNFHAIAPAVLGNAACSMGTLVSLSGWHRAHVWLDRMTEKVGCKLDAQANGSATASSGLPSNLTSFGIQVGEISIAPGVTGELNIDNLLVDANPPP